MADPLVANEHCPGSESELAGKVSACDGCPNQKICSSDTKQPDPGIELVKQRLQDVKHKILILSGKGGVGKSTVTNLLGRFLAASNDDKNVGICDVDICGPSAPRMMGVLEEQVHQSGSGWSPVYVEENLSVISIGFLLSNQKDAIIWRGPKKNAMIRQFLSEVDWGQLEYLLIDTPPGTSDEHLSVFNYLKHVNISGAVIVTTPQEVALLDVRKEIDFCRKVKIPIIGVIENMTFFKCPKCSKCSEIFKAKTGGASQMCSELDVTFLGGIPLDPKLARSCDEGKDFVLEHADSPVAVAFKEIARNNSCLKMIAKSSYTLRAFLIVLFLLTVQECEGINCYTCSSVNGSNPHCEDPINTHLSVYTEKCMVPKKNHVGLFPANFCIKITGVNTETYERMVIRACVMKTMDSQCGMFKYQDQAMNGCVLTCDYNGCNKSGKIQLPTPYLFNFFIVLIILIIK